MTSLREILTLEKIDADLYRGQNLPEREVPNRVYGGQVVGQALMAAYQMVGGKVCHSLHSYFVRPGDPKHPIFYKVERVRSGGTFEAMQVIALQNDKQLFSMTASFQSPDSGFEHQTTMPVTGEPESFLAFTEVQASIALPMELRFPTIPPFCQTGVALPPLQQGWFRIPEPLGEDVAMHQAALAFSTDIALLATAARPHAVGFEAPGMQAASLDHTIWFLAPSNLEGWHLHDMTSPAAAGGRGVAMGSVYRQDGALIALTAQEGLLRYRPPAA